MPRKNPAFWSDVSFASGGGEMMHAWQHGAAGNWREKMTTKTDRAAMLALFLTERTGSCLKTWSGKLTAAEQRALFGRFLGKGKLWIDGANETVEHYVTVCFGADAECTASLKWSAL